MMTAETAKSLYERFFSSGGSSMTLRRAGQSDISFFGFVSNLSPNALVGELQQGDVSITVPGETLTASSWTLPVRKGDKLVFDGKTYTVQSCEDFFISNELIRSNLIVRG